MRTFLIFIFAFLVIIFISNMLRDDFSIPWSDIRWGQKEDSEVRTKGTLHSKDIDSNKVINLVDKEVEKPPKIYSKNILSVSDFKQSLFYDKYKCTYDDDWPIQGGLQNYAFNITGISPWASIDISTSKDKLKHLGLMFYERSSLSEEYFVLIDDLLGELNLGSKQKKVLSYIKSNIEDNAFKISETKPLKIGRIRFRAAKVLQQTLTIDIN